jgi:hypothetical protein
MGLPTGFTSNDERTAAEEDPFPPCPLVARL